MSLLRQRAIEVSAESTFSDRRPAFALDWFVRAMSCCSEAELNVPELQARVEAGATRIPIEVRANETAVKRARRGVARWGSAWLAASARRDGPRSLGNRGAEPANGIDLESRAVHRS